MFLHRKELIKRSLKISIVFPLLFLLGSPIMLGFAFDSPHATWKMVGSQFLLLLLGVWLFWLVVILAVLDLDVSDRAARVSARGGSDLFKSVFATSFAILLRLTPLFCIIFFGRWAYTQATLNIPEITFYFLGVWVQIFILLAFYFFFKKIKRSIALKKTK